MIIALRKGKKENLKIKKNRVHFLCNLMYVRRQPYIYIYIYILVNIKYAMHFSYQTLKLEIERNNQLPILDVFNIIRREYQR